MNVKPPVAEPTRDSTLRETREYLEPFRVNRTPITVRRLISFWGYSARGENVVNVVQSDLAQMGYTTVPPFDSGVLDSIVIIEKLTHDDEPEPHLLTLSRVPSANFAIRNPLDGPPPGFVTKTDSIDDAITTMLRHDFSQLPVVHSRDSLAIVGVFSWETYAKTLARGVKPVTVEAATEPALTVDLRSDLFASVEPISKQGFVLVTFNGTLSGIVTASDLTAQFQQLAVPFLAVGRCEQELKRVAKLCFPPPKNSTYDDLALGGIRDHYKKYWGELGWSLSRDAFDAWIDTTRQLRNRIAHFDDQDVDHSEDVADVGTV
ncbi:CBS domain-containing protein [Leifsonia shinshuensis]